MRLCLLIDGNYLMQKSVFILYKLRNLYTDLPIILEKDYNTLTSLFYFNKIYFISDSRSNWRKKYYDSYKGKRKKNDDIEWNTVYEIFDKFKYDISKRNNCEIYQLDNLEGDDIISYVVKETNAKGYSNLIISNDSDLYQLINYDIVNRYMNFMYNYKFNDEKLFLPTQYNEFIKEIENNSNVNDIFDSENENMEFIDFMKGLISSKNIIEINSEKELFTRIIGYNKDSIKSIYMKGTRGIGKIGTEKIYDFYKDTYPETINFNSDEFKDRLIEVIKYYKRLKNDDMDNEMRERLNINLKIVKLDKRSIPNNLYLKMEENINI